MAIELEGLQFQIEAKSTEASKGIDALTNSFKRLKSALGGKNLSDTADKLKTISKAASGLKGVKLSGLASSLKALGSVKISATIPKRLTDIGSAVNGITSDGVDRIERMAAALEGLKGVDLSNLSKVNRTSKSTPANTVNTDNTVAQDASRKISEVQEEVTQATGPVQRLRNFLGGLSGEFGNATAVINNMAGAMRQLTGDLLPGVIRGFTGIAKGMGTVVKHVSGFNAVTKSVKRLGEGVKSVTSKFKSLFASIKRIAMYRLIRFMFSQLTKAMKDGINNLYQYSSMFGTTFASSLDRCATSFQYLKNSMGAMAAPIINLLAPALDFIIDKIVTLLNLINKFFAVLSGSTTYTVAKRAAASYADAAGEAGSAAKKAAKDIKDATLGIDELNIISPNKDAGGSGGGGGGTDYSSMFEELPIDSEFAKIREVLAELFKPLLDAWNDYGQGVIDAFHRALSSIKDLLLDIARTWRDVWLNGSGYELISNILKLLTSVLNLIADIADAFRIAWEKEGYALVQSMFDAWNAILALLTTISETFRQAWNDGTGVEIAALLLQIWTNLHRIIAQIADTIRIVWENGSGLRLCKNILNAVKEILLWIKAIQEAWMAAWDIKGINLVQSVFDMLNPVLELILTISKSFRTAFEIGSGREMFEHILQILTNINNIIGHLATGLRTAWDEAGTGNAIAQSLWNIFNTILGTIEKITASTSQWAASLNFSPILTSIKTLFENLEPVVQKIGDALSWVWENVLLPLGKWCIESSLPAFINAVSAAFSSLGAALEILKPVFQWVWEEVLTPIAFWTGAAFTGALTVITNILQKLTNLLKGNTSFSDFIDSLAPGEAIILGIAAALGVLAAAFGVAKAISVAGALISAAITAIGAAIGFLTSPIGIVIGVITALATGFTLLYQHVKPFRDFIDGIIEGAKELVPGIIEGIKSGWDAFTTWLGSLWRGIVEGFKKFFGIHSPSKVFQELGKNLIDGLLLGIQGAWSGLLTSLTGRLGEIKKAFQDAWEHIKTKAAEAWGNIKTTLAAVWENLKTAAGTAVENIRVTVSAAWENIKTATATAWEGIRQTVTQVWENLKTAAREVWNTIRTTVSTVWENLKTTAQTVFDAIKTTVSTAWDTIQTVSSDIWNGITTTLSTLWESLKTTATTVFNSIKEAVSQVWENLKTVTETIWNAVKSALETIWNGLKTTAATVFNAISTAVSTVWSTIQTTTSTIWNAIKTTLDTLWNGLKTTVTTAFNEIKTTIITIWNNIQTTSSTIWNAIKTTVVGVWNNLKAEAVTSFNNIKSTIAMAWTNIKAEAAAAWGNIKTTLTQAWDNLKTAASNSFEGIKRAIKEKWDELVRSAVSWGSDLCSNIAGGISRAIGKVTSAARGIANTISGFVHFSEPDVGPLSNFHTFMPDMLHLMAKGITDNAYLAENAAYDLAERVSKTLNTGINPAMALEVDTTGLSYYDSEKFARSISANVESRVEFASDGFEEAMENFYREYLQPTMMQMANDMRRQADKDEHPIVQIGNRIINESVKTQREADGWRFVK